MKQPSCRWAPRRHAALSSCRLIIIFSALLLLTSCKYKDLYEGEDAFVSEVRLTFDWSETHDAEVKGMTALYYPSQQAGEPIRYDYPGMNGGTARMVAGSYQALAYNYDTETILYRNMQSLETLEAFTRESSIEEGTHLAAMTRDFAMPRVAGTDVERVILEPDPLWGGASSSFLLQTGVKTPDVVVQPESYIRHVNITIENVPNLQYTGQFGAALSGLAPSVQLASHTLDNECVTQAFPLGVEGQTTLRGSVRIFGHCPHLKEGDVHEHLLTVYAILADGSKWFYTIDVTPQMHTPDPLPPGGGDPEADEEINIEIDEGLPIPKPIVNGSGFQPTIDGWQGVEIEVKM